MKLSDRIQYNDIMVSKIREIKIKLSNRERERRGEEDLKKSAKVTEKSHCILYFIGGSLL